MDLVYLTSPIFAGIQVLGSLVGLCKMIYVSYTWTEKIWNENIKKDRAHLTAKLTVKVEPRPLVHVAQRPGPVRQFVKGQAY